MKNVKQTIIVRKDLKMQKGRMASVVSQASMKFLIENNEAERGDEIRVRLSQQEAEWINSSFSRSVLSVDSQEALKDIAFKCEMSGIDVYYVFDDKELNEGEIRELLSISLGPDEEDLIEQVVGSLKSV